MGNRMVFIKALSVFLGTVIGVGIFGLPFIAGKAGFSIVFLYFLVITPAAILINFLYAEVALGTEKNYRFPGYVGEYLGSSHKKLSFFIIIVGLIGALLAYLVIGGEFLSHLFGPYFGGNADIYTLLFFAFGVFLVFRGIKSVSQIELFLLFLLLAILAALFVKAAPFINFNYFTTYNFKNLALPYGVVLFSLWGSALIPEIEEMFIEKKLSVGEVRKGVRSVISKGLIITAAVYLLFIFVILGVSGPGTSKEAIFGIYQVLGGNVIKLGFVFGIICCFTSFITLALTLKKVFIYDLGLLKGPSFFLACFLPLILFLMGLKNFIDIISFTGALCLGAEAIMTVFLYRAFLRKKLLKKINPALYFLVFIFSLGIIYELFYFFGGLG